MRTPKPKLIRFPFDTSTNAGWTIKPLGTRWKPAIKKTSLDRQQASKMAFLPDDILLLVIEFLDDAGKACLIRTCRYFRSLLEPILYRHLFLYPDTGIFPKSNRLHNTLIVRQDLLPHVLTYHGPLAPNPPMAGPSAWTRKTSGWYRFRRNSSPSGRPATREERLGISETIFPRMINLRDLHFTDFFDWSTQQLWDSFDHLKSSMALQRLVLRIGGDPQRAISILRAQPGLKHLEFLPGGGHRVEGLQKTDIPELSSLKATFSQAVVIVPGRPVTKLELTQYYGPYQTDHQNPLNEDLFRQLALSTSAITDFAVRLQRPWDDAVVKQSLQLFARVLPRIERLRVFVCGMVTESILLETLPEFNSLLGLKLIGAVVKKKPYDGNSTICGQQDLAQISQKLKEHCPALIDVEWCRRERHYCCSERGV